MAVMKDIAEKVGVSVSTVSFVLNGTAREHKVADATAKKVIKAARDLGYHRNNAIQGSCHLAKKETFIGIFYPACHCQSELGIFTETIYEHLTSRNILCSLMILPYENGHLMEKISSSDWSTLDAALVVSADATDLASLKKSRHAYPLVLFNASLPNYCSVVCFMTDAIKKLVEMIALKGYKEATIISSKNHPNINDAFFPTLLDACKNAGITVDGEHIISVDNTSYGGAIAARKILNLKERPTLILSTNSTLALGSIPVFARNEFYIPHHAELAAFALDGELNYLQNHIPSLSVILFPLRQLAGMALEMALSLSLDNQKEPAHYECQCELVLNESFSI